MVPIASMDPTFATFLLASFVLIAGVVIALVALCSKVDADRGKLAFTSVGVLFGLFAAGGLGSLFANQAAETAADAAAQKTSKAATVAANRATSKIGRKIEKFETEVTSPASPPNP